jgi:regulation of enolase protein 1 (concanavalin A-like superfamily)
MNDLSALKSATWHNPPPVWSLQKNTLTVETGPKTDFWRDTLYGFRRDDGHGFLTGVSGDFTALITFDGDYDTLYDQAGIMLRQNASHWLKAGIEVSDDVLNMSVVVTRNASDWSTLALPSASGPQRLRLTRIGTAIVVQFRNSANRWQLLRVADFAVGQDLMVGPMACSPQRSGFRAVFTEFSISAPVAEPLHDETPAT